MRLHAIRWSPANAPCASLVGARRGIRSSINYAPMRSLRRDCGSFQDLKRQRYYGFQPDFILQLASVLLGVRTSGSKA